MQDAAASTSNLTFGDKDLDQFQAQNFIGKKTNREFLWMGIKNRSPPRIIGPWVFFVWFFHEDLRVPSTGTVIFIEIEKYLMCKVLFDVINLQIKTNLCCCLFSDSLFVYHRKPPKKKNICQIGQKKILQGTSQLNGSHLFGTSEEFPSTQKVRKEIGKKGKSWYFRMAKFSRESWLIVP